MAHPINNIDYLIREWDWLHRDAPSAFYAFFLFNQDDGHFAQFFDEYFEAMDQWSGRACMFFAIAPPPADWSKRAKKREYWKHYLANVDRNVGYDWDAVKQAARYFSIPAEHLPAVVLFRDIEHMDIVTIRLEGLSQEKLAAYFFNLFALLNTENVRRWPLFRLRRLIDILPLQEQLTRGRLHELAIQYDAAVRESPAAQYTFLPPDLQAHDIASRTEFPQTVLDILESVQVELRRLTREVEELRGEQREAFRQVNVRLEQIQVVLEETVNRIERHREPFLERWASLDEQIADPEELREAKARLHAEFDDFLEAESRQLAERLRQPGEGQLPAVVRPFDSLLEPETREELITADTLWNYLTQVQLPFSVDYSVCGIGLWKALEIEANRVFVDALRVYHSLCIPGSASARQAPLRTGKLVEGGLFQNKERDVPIYFVNDGYLMGVELGKVAGLVANARGNPLGTVCSQLSVPPGVSYPTVHEYLDDIAKELSHVTNHYRNRYSHIQTMKHPACQQLRSYFFNDGTPNNPFFATLRFKRELLAAQLI